MIAQNDRLDTGSAKKEEKIETSEPKFCYCKKEILVLSSSMKHSVENINSCCYFLARSNKKLPGTPASISKLN